MVFSGGKCELHGFVVVLNVRHMLCSSILLLIFRFTFRLFVCLNHIIYPFDYIIMFNFIFWGHAFVSDLYLSLPSPLFFDNK